MDKFLKTGLEALSNLSAMRNSGPCIAAGFAAEKLSVAIEPLAKAAGFTVASPAPLALREYRQTFVDQQECKVCNFLDHGPQNNILKIQSFARSLHANMT